jgi:hypothetical protein
VDLKSLRNIFGKTPPETPPSDRATLTGPRIPRHSTGWSAMLKHLKEEESLNVLDIGQTSSSNINLLTGLGHSLYMSDLVIEALRGGWHERLSEDPLAEVDAYFEQHLDFGGRLFDVVLLWSTLDFIPEPLVVPLIARLHASLNPKGRILAFFHTKLPEGETVFYRYHATGSEDVEMQEAGRLTLRQVSNNRKIEKLFAAYQNCKFFLAKDNLSEVIVTR